MAGTLTAFRAAFYDTPWWVNPNRSAGRYNRALWGPVQYWSLHPLTPVAERLRWLGPDIVDDLDTVLNRLWVANVDSDGCEEVTFDNAHEFGIRPEDLVDDDYGPTQALAERLVGDGVSGIMAPSAALPGTKSLVLFGGRVRHPYLLDPIDPEQVRTAHAADGGVPLDVIPHIRWRGAPHAGLEHWRATGEDMLFLDPPVTGP